MIQTLKLFLILIFIAGVLIRVFSPVLQITQVGNILIAVGILGRLLVYVRGLSPSAYHSIHEAKPLKLNPDRRRAFSAYDETSRTPIERVILDDSPQ
jgi:nitrogen regulatory protein PII-like uncharacterized protein